jgi:hypothetical protein
MSFTSTFPTNLPKFSIVIPAITITIASNDYPLYIIPAGEACELRSKASGITPQNVTTATQDLPRYMVIRGKASELRSKITI